MSVCLLYIIYKCNVYIYIYILHVYLCHSSNLPIHLGLLSCANVHKLTKPGLATRITQIRQKKVLKKKNKRRTNSD